MNIGEPFEDHGNTPEYFVSRFAAYEFLPDGMVRLFLCKPKGETLVLEYSAIVPVSAIAEMGRKCLEVAGAFPAAQLALETKTASKRVH